MKRLLGLLIIAISFTTLSAQPFETGPDSLQGGVRDTLIVYSPLIDGY